MSSPVIPNPVNECKDKPISNENILANGTELLSAKGVIT